MTAVSIVNRILENDDFDTKSLLTFRDHPIYKETEIGTNVRYNRPGYENINGGWPYQVKCFYCCPPDREFGGTRTHVCDKEESTHIHITDGVGHSYQTWQNYIKFCEIIPGERRYMPPEHVSESDDDGAYGLDTKSFLQDRVKGRWFRMGSTDELYHPVRYTTVSSKDYIRCIVVNPESSKVERIVMCTAVFFEHPFVPIDPPNLDSRTAYRVQNAVQDILDPYVPNQWGIPDEEDHYRPGDDN